MPGSVIVAGARTPIGKLSGAFAGFTAMDLGGFAIAAALEKAGVKPEDVDYVFMGQVLQAGARPDHRSPGRGQGRHPDDGPGHHDQQGVPQRPEHDLPGRPAHRQRRGRRGRGRRHGVDDACAVPAARTRGPATASATARWSTRWRSTACSAPSTSAPWAPAPRSTPRRPTASAATARTRSPPPPTSGRRRP